MSNLRGAEIVVRALEDEGIPFTFGIPGGQNLELYDALADSPKTHPILVTDEQSASFMADGAWRASGSLCCVNLVPGAGLTHALSGIAEAYMDGIPMLVLACGIRSDTDKSYQLHDIDQLAVARPVTKQQIRVADGRELYAAIRNACQAARNPPGGPVIVEIPANLLVFRQEADFADWKLPPAVRPKVPQATIDSALALIAASKRPLLYVGVGAGSADGSLLALAEHLEAPVATTIHGKGVFPEDHPLRLWCGFGPMAPSFVRSVVEGCDLTLAIGCRFSEVATGSYGLDPPRPLIHVDIDSSVFGRNYPVDLAVEADAAAVVSALLEHLPQRQENPGLRDTIKTGHDALKAKPKPSDAARGVLPPSLFHELQRRFGDKTVFVLDSGNGLFEAMESLRLNHARSFLAPVDFSCMGYAVPAAIGAALAAPDRPVVAVVGDGALLMTGLELLTASQLDVPVVIVVLRDHELSQITQFQESAFARKTASTLYDFDLAIMCRSIGLDHLRIEHTGELGAVLEKASEIRTSRRPVVVEAIMDRSYRTFFTRGVIRTNFGRLPWADRLRFLARVVERRVMQTAHLSNLLRS